MLNFRRRPALAACLAVSLWCAAAQADKLQRLREETGHSPSSSSSDDDDDDDCNSLGAAILAGLFGAEVNGCSAPDDSSSGSARSKPQTPQAFKPASHYFTPFPYAAGNAGNTLHLNLPAGLSPLCEPHDALCAEREVAFCVNDDCYLEPPTALDLPQRQRQLQAARAQFFADAGRDTEGLLRGTLGLNVYSNAGIGIDTRWTYWMEPLANGEVDGVWLGDVNLRFELVSLPALQLAVGAGPRVLADTQDAVPGANAMLALELYPVRPLVVRAEADAGNLGKALFWEAQGSLGVMVQRVELYAGVARFVAGDLRFDSAFGGLRAHL